MDRIFSLVLNALAGAGIIVYVTLEPTVGWAGHTEELVFYIFASLLFLLTAAGLLLRIRWMVVIPAIALFLGGLLLALFFLAGGGIAVLETVTVIAAWRMNRTAPRTSTAPSP